MPKLLPSGPIVAIDTLAPMWLPLVAAFGLTEWASTPEIKQEIESYRTERQQHLVELGTKGAPRYEGAKLNGRSPYAAANTCRAGFQRCAHLIE